MPLAGAGADKNLSASISVALQGTVIARYTRLAISTAATAAARGARALPGRRLRCGGQRHLVQRQPSAGGR
jgi:hypothetical protein